MARIRNTKPRKPSFFMVLIGDFSTKLELPKAFDQNLKGKNTPATFKISLRSGVINEISWDVKLDKSSNNGRCYFFSEGWSKLVDDLHLVQGDFLVFHLKAPNTFQITPYAPTCCEKNIRFLDDSDGNEAKGRQYVKEEVDDDDDDEDKNDESRNETQSGDTDRSMQPYFKKTLRDYQLRFFALPMSFMREAGNLCNEKEVVIKDGHGKKWGVVMNTRKVGANSVQFNLVTGWSKFIRGNGIGVGDTLRFQYVGGCMIQVEVVCMN